jgi:hypothetical protein
MQLKYNEWTELDALLSKMGFGGYYDVVEILKMSITNLKPEYAQDITQSKDIFELIHLLYLCSISRREGKEI